MNQVKIVTDSTADLPPDLAAKYNITVVPLMVIFNDNEIFRDGVDIDTGQFYRRQIERKEYSRTSQPAPAEFTSIYRNWPRPAQRYINTSLLCAKRRLPLICGWPETCCRSADIMTIPNWPAWGWG